MTAAGASGTPQSGMPSWGDIAASDPHLLVDLVAAASDITLMLDAAGRILGLRVNPASSDFGKLDHWVGRPITDFLTPESIPKFESSRDRLAQGGPPSRPIEINHRDNAVWEFPIRYVLQPVGTDGALLMMGRDLRPVAETQRQLVQAQIALERGYEAQREFDSRYRLLLATVTDAIALVSLSDGRVTDANDHAADLFGGARKDLIGTVFASQFAETRRTEMEARLVNAAMSERAEPILLTTARTGRPLVLVPNVFRVGGDRVAICRLAPQNAPTAADIPAALPDALFAAAIEGILFTDTKGVIRDANERFLSMVDAGALPSVKSRTLGEFLARGQVDLGVILENVQRLGEVRMYATELVSDFGSRVPVELSATRLRTGDGPPLIGFVFRDASRAETMRLPPAQGGGASQANILELVGSASLKEIVAETSDVIEKLCIETAIKLTNNNRVAAAEMLGLSRQSLYVKLRKYDFLKKGEDD
ncbi:transcriptional regulator PpsR [Meridianimarinicoccus sp. RP-17]